MTREENLHWIDEEIRTWENECQSKHPIKEALYAARKALEQEPFMNKLCISSKVCEHDKEVVLDKIRAEIKGYESTIDNAISEDELKIEGMKEAYVDCLEIIDKYKAESEGEE